MARNLNGWSYFAKITRNPDGSITLTLMNDTLWQQLTNGLEYLTGGAEYVAVTFATDPFRPPL